MAWFSNLAGRAEAFLENLDQATATSLDKVGIGTPQKQAQEGLREKESFIIEENIALLKDSDSFIGPSRPIQTPAKPATVRTNPASPTEWKTPVGSKDSQTTVDDDSLLAFLNSPPKKTPSQFSGRKKPAAKTTQNRQPTPSSSKHPKAHIEGVDWESKRTPVDASTSSMPKALFNFDPVTKHATPTTSNLMPTKGHSWRADESISSEPTASPQTPSTDRLPVISLDTGTAPVYAPHTLSLHQDSSASGWNEEPLALDDQPWSVDETSEPGSDAPPQHVGLEEMTEEERDLESRLMPSKDSVGSGGDGHSRQEGIQSTKAEPTSSSTTLTESDRKEDSFGAVDGRQPHPKAPADQEGWEGSHRELGMDLGNENWPGSGRTENSGLDRTNSEHIASHQQGVEGGWEGFGLSGGWELGNENEMPKKGELDQSNLQPPIRSDRKNSDHDSIRQAQDLFPAPVHGVDAPQVGSSTADQLPCSSTAGLVKGTRDGDGEGEMEVEDPELTEMRTRLVGLESQNSLLQREVGSLREETTSSALRLKHLQDSNARYQQEVMLSREKVASLEKEVEQSSLALRDCQDSYSTRCEEFRALGQRLASIEQDMKSTKDSLVQTTAEKNRLVQDTSDISGAHTTTLNNLRQQLTSTQQALSRETQAHARIQESLEDGKRMLGEELASTRTELQALTEVLQGKTTADEELNKKLHSAAEDYQYLQKEYRDYKHKATSILQAKSEEISDLKKQATSSGCSPGGGGSDEGRERLEEELAKCQEVIRDLQAQMETLEEGAEVEVSGLEALLAVTKESLVRKENSHSDLQLELGRVRAELDQTRMELLTQSSTLAAQIKEKEDAIEELESRWALMSVSSSPSEGGRPELEQRLLEQRLLEQRLQELTESLIAKQGLVEALSSEKHSMLIQIEALGREVQSKEQALTVQSKQQSVVISGLDEMEVGAPAARMRTMSSILPSAMGAGAGESSQLSQRVFRAATALDTFSVRLGVFLRRHPQARLFIIFYGVLLHLWVIFVLLAYKPEVHTPDDCMLIK